jgi:hypothetical protein
MAELTLEEAREVYKKSDELKEMMLAKFSKEALEKHDVSQEEFDKTFLELLAKCTKTVFLDENGYKSGSPTNRIELRNSDDRRLFDIQFTGKKHFCVSYLRIWKIFESRYELPAFDESRDNEIQRLMKNQMKLRFGMDDITPDWIFDNFGPRW